METAKEAVLIFISILLGGIAFSALNRMNSFIADILGIVIFAITVSALYYLAQKKKL